jgi:hypothetical protein
MCGLIAMLNFRSASACLEKLGTLTDSDFGHLSDDCIEGGGPAP